MEMWRKAEGNTFNTMMSSIKYPDNKPQTASPAIARYPSISLTSSNDVFMEREKIAQLGQAGRLVIATSVVRELI
ncbi:hypothetical protein AOLI_G00285050 [Acnodon oligacanthus]